jgi:hypothetical protein
MSLFLVSQEAEAATCVGSNCELIDLFAKKAGMSLDRILTEVDRNIINPIVDSQKLIAAWEGGFLQFSPNGSESSVKIIIWAGGSWRQVVMDGRFLGSSIQFDYYTGNSSLSLGAEFPIGKSTDVILNGSYWSGSSDYGTGISEGNMRETSGRFGVGIRQTFFEIDSLKLFGVSGLSFGGRKADMSLSGTVVRIQLPRERITWSGEEKYYENSQYLSVPVIAGISYGTGWISFSISGGAMSIFQSGKIEISKWGPVGPYGGYYNVGISDSSSSSGFSLIPVANVGIESSFKSGPDFVVNFRPSINDSLSGGSIGLGWKFLVSR